MSATTFRQRNCYCKSWYHRNDSSNVAAVLNHLYCEEDDNICYCHEKKIPPRLFSKPKECIFIDDVNEPKILFEKPFSSTGSSGAFKIPRHLKLSEKSSKHRSKPDEYLSETDKFKSKTSRGLFSSGLDLSQKQDFSRQKSEDIWTTNDKSKSAKDSAYFDKSEREKSMHLNNYPLSPTSSAASISREAEIDDDDRRKSTTHEIKTTSTKTVINGRKLNEKKGTLPMGFDEEGQYQKYEENKDKFKESSFTDFTEADSKMALSNLATVGDVSTKSDLKQLSDFRKDHFFETHSTEDLIKPIPEHICVHRFGLDDRLLPQPLYADVYGASRCIICDKPMDAPSLNKIDERTLKKKNILPKFYKYGLAPKKIYMGNDEKVKIEMKLDCKNEDLLVKMQEKPNYFNTYALRYQKGVV